VNARRPYQECADLPHVTDNLPQDESFLLIQAGGTCSRGRSEHCLSSFLELDFLHFNMQFVGFRAGRDGIRRADSQKGAFGWKDHLLLQQDSYSSQSSLLATKRNPTASLTCLQYKYRYRDLQEEEVNRSSTICVGQFFYKWKQLKWSSRDNSTGERKGNSSSLTDGSSESRSLEEKEKVAEKPSTSTAAVSRNCGETMGQSSDDVATQEKFSVRVRNTNIDLMPYNSGQERHIKDASSYTFESNIEQTLGGDSLNYSLSDHGRSSSFSGHEWFVKGSTSDNDVTSNKWIRYVQDEMTNVIIAKLVEDCEYYQSETVALREEVEFMKIELGCLRQQIPGMKSGKC
jgi:hypothetical protein